MKFAFIPYIALGWVLLLAVRIEYTCEGTEIFPVYYGNPFVFKQKSLGSSMEYFYSISGLLLNVLVWSAFLFFIHQAIVKLTNQVRHKKWISIPYKLIIGILTVFTTLLVMAEFSMLGRGFDESANYWYWNLDKEAADWGVTCKGKLKVGF